MPIKDQFGIIHDLQMSATLQTSFLDGTSFAISYSKPALVFIIFFTYTVNRSWRAVILFNFSRLYDIKKKL